MKIIKMNKLVCMLGLLVLMVACSKDEEIPVEADYTIELVQTISAFEVKSVLLLTGQIELANKVQYGVDVFRFEYPMEYLQNSITASGLVCVPKVSGQTFPVLCFQHGTMVEKKMAPSVGYNELINRGINSFAALGYVLVIPDYVGFGASVSYFHPYLHKQSNVDAVYSMLENIKKVPQEEFSGVSISDSLFLAGYSQGGWVTLATLNYFEKVVSNSSWNIIATMCGSGPYDLEAVKDFAFSLADYEQPYFLPYGLLSFQETGYDIGSMSNYFKEPYASNIPNLYDGINTDIQINNALTTRTSELVTDSFLNNYESTTFDALRLAFRENKVDAWKCESPLLLVHGDADIYIPANITREIYRAFTQSGSSNVNMEILPDLDHALAVFPTATKGLEFFDSYRN